MIKKPQSLIWILWFFAFKYYHIFYVVLRGFKIRTIDAREM